MAKRNKVPVFLQGTQVGDIAWCRDVLQNWMKTHSVISKLPPDVNSLKVLRKLMICEYLRDPGPRMDIVVRLHGRYDRLRYEVERVQLQA